MNAYTPPDYDDQPDTRYPVLYLQHGVDENERAGSSKAVRSLFSIS